LDIEKSYEWLMENYYPLIQKIYLPMIEKPALERYYFPVICNFW